MSAGFITSKSMSLELSKRVPSTAIDQNYIISLVTAAHVAVMDTALLCMCKYVLMYAGINSVSLQYVQ